MAVSLVQSVQADPPSLNPIAPTAADPIWRVGPTKVDLGKYAVLEVPQGYRFTDERGARTLLERMKNPASPDLVGLLAPDSGRWWIVVEYSGIGYVRNVDKGVDIAKALQGIQEKVDKENERRAAAGAPLVGTIKWAIEPRFDSKTHTLEWALEAPTATDKVLNHTVRLLGRRGVVDTTAVQSQNNGEAAIPLKDLAENISFKPGEAYGDYQAGDSIAAGGLTDLIIGRDATQNTKLVLGAGIWAGVIFLGCALAGVAVALRRKYLQFKEGDTVLALSNGNGSGHANSSRNGKNRVSRNGSGERRRVFNYHKFYSDMMLQVSAGPSVLDGHLAVQHRRANGSNGNSNGNGKSLLLDSGANQSIYQANLDLIASQGHLIEEQKRLLQEQSKLIEEKTRLIREKNDVLDKQTELFERDIL